MSCCSGFSHPTDCPLPPHPFSLCGVSLQAKSCICHMCGAHLNRLHSCLYCVFFGCFTKKHIHEHAKNKRHNLGKPCHSLASALFLPCVQSHLFSHSHAPLWPTAASANISEGLQHYFQQNPPLSRPGAECLSNCSTLPFWWERLIQSNVMGLSLYMPLHRDTREGFTNPQQLESLASVLHADYAK